MANYQFAITKILEFYGEVEADSEAEATQLVRDQLEWITEPDTEDVILNLYRVDDE